MRILVLGVGNILLRDEGVGIRVLRHLQALYDFPPNVRLADGGVLGLKLTGVMMDADQVVIIDAVRGGGEPGTIYRFDWESKPGHIQYKDSLHQIDLAETMGSIALVADPPRVLVLGVEYQDIDDWGLELTPPVARAVPVLVDMVVEQLARMGAEPSLKPRPEVIEDVFGSAGKGY